jgi:hypothetical protein
MKKINKKSDKDFINNRKATVLFIDDSQIMSNIPRSTVNKL